MLPLQHQHPCTSSGSQLCLLCVAAFVTTQAPKTSEPFMLMPICLVSLNSIEAATVLKQLHSGPYSQAFIDS
jgi:hypothetical protein